ncbi:MAG: Rne/Rng family ribonuclease [Candidatus Omnitrophica bacterium]|nr:Rne/Rng family ribonuclease [Candidatus Omnitrophota bacterium]
MAKEILINVESQEKRVVVLAHKVLDEFYIERPQDKTIVGNIYKGRIEAVIPSINGAFVDIGLPKKGFLYLSEIESAYESVEKGPDDAHGRKQAPKEVKKGQEVLVQVVKESFGTKGPRLSCHIGIAGRYLVLMPLDPGIGVSRRIESDEERKRLRVAMGELALPKDLGFIVRTAATGKTKQELVRDANFLVKLWRRMEKTVGRQKTPSVVYEEYDLTLRVIRDSFTEDVAKLVVDSKPEFYRILKFIHAFMGPLRKKVEFYRGPDLFSEHDVERQVAKVFEKKVFMKSKAYLVIEPTEGLVVIDVNSGGFKEKVRQEEAAFKVNCEAAIEAAHQLRLRDLGGIIVIDFIDMEREFHRREVLRVLKDALKQDKAKYDILGISKFGVVEMTRERIHNTVATLSYQDCPYCGGRGKVKSPTTMSIQAIKELRKFCAGKRLRQVNLTVHPDVAAEITRDRQSLKNVERTYHVRVDLVSNSSFKIEDIAIA